MPLPADDLSWLIQDSGGVLVAIGASSTYGHLDSTDVAWEEGGVTVDVQHLVVTVPTGELSGLAVGAAITVGGVGYQVADHRRKEDGALTEILLGSA